MSNIEILNNVIIRVHMMRIVSDTFWEISTLFQTLTRKIGGLPSKIVIDE